MREDYNWPGKLPHERGPRQGASLSTPKAATIRKKRDCKAEHVRKELQKENPWFITPSEYSVCECGNPPQECGEGLASISPASLHNVITHRAFAYPKSSTISKLNTDPALPYHLINKTHSCLHVTELHQNEAWGYWQACKSLSGIHHAMGTDSLYLITAANQTCKKDRETFIPSEKMQ